MSPADISNTTPAVTTSSMTRRHSSPTVFSTGEMLSAPPAPSSPSSSSSGYSSQSSNSSWDDEDNEMPALIAQQPQPVHQPRQPQSPQQQPQAPTTDQIIRRRMFMTGVDEGRFPRFNFFTGANIAMTGRTGRTCDPCDAFGLPCDGQLPCFNCARYGNEHECWYPSTSETASSNERSTETRTFQEVSRQPLAAGPHNQVLHNSQWQQQTNPIDPMRQPRAPPVSNRMQRYLGFPTTEPRPVRHPFPTPNVREAREAVEAVEADEEELNEDSPRGPSAMVMAEVGEWFREAVEEEEAGVEEELNEDGVTSPEAWNAHQCGMQ